MKNVLPPSSTLTNMRILDTEHAKDIYERLLKKQNVSALTLRPISYFDPNLQEQVGFNVERTRQQFEEICSGWGVGASEEDQWNDMFQTIKWEPCDGQHILYACNILAQEAFQKGHITKEDLDNIFSTRKAVVVVYDNPKMYLEMSKRQNDFNIPNRKDSHASAWQTLVKLRALWINYGRPKAREDEDIQRRGDMLMCMATILNQKLEGEKNLTITKVSTKLYDWISHACRDDDEAFDCVIRIGKEVDNRVLHLDPARAKAWKKYVQAKKKNFDVKKPKIASMTINWLRPLRGLLDSDYKQVVQTALYNEGGQGQSLYFNDVDKPFPGSKTLEFVSLRLRQRYAVKNALRWLQMEGNIASYKKIKDFLQIDVSRFGEHDTLVALGQLGTKNFISHWASPLYVYVSALKKYAEEIPGAIRAHHRDIVNGGKGFLGKVKLIENGTYSLKGWLWETRIKKQVKGSEEQREIHIMHRGGLFTSGGGQLGKPTLWVIDCRWGSTAGEDKTWSKKDYMEAIQLLENWMNGCPRWNVVFLCPEGANVRFLIEDLKERHRIIRYGTWAFTSETTRKKDNLLFGGQEVVSMEAIGDVIIVMVCPENSNPIDNVSHTNMPLPRVFHDYESKYAATKGDARRRTPEEISRLVNCYLPKDWTIVLVGLCSTIPAIIEEGFKGNQILTFDDNIESSMRLSEWIRQHDGVVFQFPLQESDRYESESDRVQREKDHEAHTNTEMDDDDNGDDNDDEENDDDDDEMEMDNNDNEDDTISLLEPEVVAPKETGTKRKRKDSVPMNVVRLERFAVENIQSSRRSSRSPKATEKIIGHDKGKTMASNIFFKKKRSSTSRRPSTITTFSQGEPTTVIMTRIPSSSIDHSVTITETPTNQVEFKVGDRVNLLDIHDDIIVAIAKIISIPGSGQLHNRMQPEGFYKVAVEEVVVGESPLMVPNKDDDPEQLYVRDVEGTMTAWRHDRIAYMK